MNRRGVLTVLAFLVVGVGIGAFVASWLHNSPAAMTAAASSETGADGSPVVDVNFTTVAQVGSGDHPNWVGYLPTTYVKVPPNATVRVTIDQQDGASGLRNPYLGLVRGTVGNAMTVNGKALRAIDPATLAHSFSVPDLGVSVPLLAVDASAPAGSSNKIVFSFKVPASGIFHWQCFVPCGAGTLYGLGGPMQTLGYMDGQIEVGS
ncbi:MAG: hypothetical protein M3019_03970 [Candidatus Dormibacteraeota bacterium]|nr:hypothetical protein [Candidatus Dormibacteraeota bacterium]